MKRGEPVPASVRAERSRAATKAATARELLYAGILARLWPSYVTTVIRENPEFPWLLCVESPVGLLIWRLSIEERPFFEWIAEKPNAGERAIDRTPLLMALAADGWI